MNNFIKAAKIKPLLSEKKLLERLWPWQIDNESKKMRGKPISSGKAILVLCIASFIAGSLFTSRTWIHTSPSQAKDHQNVPLISHYVNKLQEVKRDCDHKRVSFDYFTSRFFFLQELKFNNLTRPNDVNDIFFRNLLKENLEISWEKLRKPIKLSSELIELINPSLSPILFSFSVSFLYIFVFLTVLIGRWKIRFLR